MTRTGYKHTSLWLKYLLLILLPFSVFSLITPSHLILQPTVPMLSMWWKQPADTIAAAGPSSLECFRGTGVVLWDDKLLADVMGRCWAGWDHHIRRQKLRPCLGDLWPPLLIPALGLTAESRGTSLWRAAHSVWLTQVLAWHSCEPCQRDWDWSPPQAVSWSWGDEAMPLTCKRGRLMLSSGALRTWGAQLVPRV